jgi:hypothetical protein
LAAHYQCERAARASTERQASHRLRQELRLPDVAFQALQRDAAHLVRQRLDVAYRALRLAAAQEARRAGRKQVRRELTDEREW